MSQYNIHDKLIKKDSWVKEIRKTFNPELLADLIKKRIEFPASTGPLISTFKEEAATDIIDAFIADSEEYRKKITPAVGLLLYKMMHGKMTESHEILRGVFAIIRESKLTDCHKLVYNWLQLKHNVQTSSDVKWKHTYREGMMAYAQIQSKDEKNEGWWLNIWREGSSVWWPPAFLGLRIQNPTAACAELPLLITRHLTNEGAMAGYLLVGMWNDPDARGLIERAIRRGLDENTGWAGRALNMILEKLTEQDKNQLMLNLKTLTKPN